MHVILLHIATVSCLTLKYIHFNLYNLLLYLGTFART